MSDDEDWIPIEAFFDEEGTGPNLDSDPRAALHEADVVIGRDTMTRNEFLLYGRDAMKRIAGSRRAEPLAVLRVELDQDAEELEKIIALIEVVKGQCDYVSPRDN